MNALRDTFLAIAIGGLTLIGTTLFLTFTVGAWCIGVYQLFAWVLA